MMKSLFNLQIGNTFSLNLVSSDTVLKVLHLFQMQIE